MNPILTGYLTAYGYLLAVMALSLGLNRLSRDDELSRKIVHIAAGLGWNIYRAFFPATVHPVIISASFVLVTVITTVKQTAFLERGDDSRGTLYFTGGMTVMSLLGWIFPALFDPFGVAIVCLSCGDGFAGLVGARFGRIKLYQDKSLAGSVACAVFSALAITALVLVWGLPLGPWEIALLSLVCAVTELFSGRWDNLAIPFLLLFLSYILLYDMPLGAALLAGMALGVLCAVFRVLTIEGSLLLWALLTFVYCFGGPMAYFALLAIFIVIMAADKLVVKLSPRAGKDSENRSAGQLAANCLPATAAIILCGLTGNGMFLLAFFAAAAETVADSMASDVGVLSKKAPVDICTGKPIRPGVSGGVSVLGTLCALAACLWAGLVYLLFFRGRVLHAALIALAALLGVLLDSVLGSRVQARFRCAVCGKPTEKRVHCGAPSEHVSGLRWLDNSRVNVVCNIFSCLLAALLAVITI